MNISMYFYIPSKVNRIYLYDKSNIYCKMIYYTTEKEGHKTIVKDEHGFTVQTRCNICETEMCNACRNCQCLDDPCKFCLDVDPSQFPYEMCANCTVQDENEEFNKCHCCGEIFCDECIDYMCNYCGGCCLCDGGKLISYGGKMCDNCIRNKGP